MFLSWRKIIGVQGPSKNWIIPTWRGRTFPLVPLCRISSSCLKLSFYLITLAEVLVHLSTLRAFDLWHPCLSLTFVATFLFCRLKRTQCQPSDQISMSCLHWVLLKSCLPQTLQYQKLASIHLRLFSVIWIYTHVYLTWHLVGKEQSSVHHTWVCKYDEEVFIFRIQSSNLVDMQSHGTDLVKFSEVWQKWKQSVLAPRILAMNKNYIFMQT